LGRVTVDFKSGADQPAETMFYGGSARIEPLLSTVVRGLDPRIHLLAKRWIAAELGLSEVRIYYKMPQLG
jgi:hypothetical protein